MTKEKAERIQTSKKEEAIIIKLLCDFGFNAISFEEFCARNPDNWKWTPSLDQQYGDIVILFKNRKIHIDAKRNGKVSKDSLDRFIGDYFLFYYWKIDNPILDINALEWLQTGIAQRYVEEATKGNIEKYKKINKITENEKVPGWTFTEGWMRLREYADDIKEKYKDE